MNIKPGILLLAFFVLLFLLNYYDLFHILDPVRTGLEKRPTLSMYVLYNFSFRVIFYGFKFFILASLFYGCSVFFNLKYDSESSLFKEVFSLVVLLEYIFLVEKIYKIIYFTFLDTDYTYNDYVEFYPLSLYAVNSNGFILLNKILKELSLFDLAYISAMIVGVKTIFDIPTYRSLLFAAVAYIVPLILWVFLLHFIGL